MLSTTTKRDSKKEGLFKLIGYGPSCKEGTQGRRIKQNHRKPLLAGFLPLACSVKFLIQPIPLVYEWHCPHWPGPSCILFLKQIRKCTLRYLLQPTTCLSLGNLIRARREWRKMDTHTNIQKSWDRVGHALWWRCICLMHVNQGCRMKNEEEGLADLSRRSP